MILTVKTQTHDELPDPGSTIPFALSPGKNELKIGIDELANVNGSAPDLSAVGKWYFSCPEGGAPTLFFGDIWLVGDDLPTTSAA